MLPARLRPQRPSTPRRLWPSKHQRQFGSFEPLLETRAYFPAQCYRLPPRLLPLLELSSLPLDRQALLKLVPNGDDCADVRVIILPGVQILPLGRYKSPKG